MSVKASHPEYRSKTQTITNLPQSSEGVQLDFALRKYGDVNGDCRYNIVDALRAAKHAMFQITLPADAVEAGDVNCSGGVTMSDALLIAKKAVGLSATPWGGCP